MAEHTERVVHLAKKNLKRVLGTWELFSIGYGDVGSSIYYALGATALYAMGATPLALLIAGFVFICTSLTYAEMSSTFPEPGGSATFSRYAFNDLISFIAGWGLLLDYIVTVAISAFAIPPYLASVFASLSIPYPASNEAHILMTLAIIALLYLLNLVGIQHSGFLSLLLAVVTILSQAAIILIAGLLFLNLPHVWAQMKIGVPGVDWSPTGLEFLKGVAMAMVAYTGIEAIAQLAAEAKRPSITVPKAIRWTMGTLVLLYFGISVVGLSVVSPEELGTTYLDNPITGIVSHFPVGGAFLTPWFGLIAAIILLIASNAGLIGCSRLAYSMGEYYQLPHFFHRLHPIFRTPHLALAIFSAIAGVIVIWSRGEMLFLADLYNFGAQIAFFSAHVSLLVLRWKKPELPRPYKAPFNIPLGNGRSWPLTALLGTLATFATWLVVVATKPEGRTLGFLWIGVGLAMYLFYRRHKKIAPMGQLSIEKIKIPEYQPMHLKHVLVTARGTGNTEALQTACQLAKSQGAKLTAVYVVEIPPTLPMDAAMGRRETMGEAALKRAEAVAREYHLTIELELVRARSLEGALFNLIEHGDFDLVVVGSTRKDFRDHTAFATQAQKLLKEAPCRVLFCKS